ncbi:MAG: hypothetical protein LBR79_04105 [Oscillospiraceae bacterium]|nr:hypothetical protein [Oscillospiraceae bacterium]
MLKFRFFSSTAAIFTFPPAFGGGKTKNVTILKDFYYKLLLSLQAER